MSAQDKAKYLRALFLPSEYVSVGAAAWETRVISLDEAIEAEHVNLVSANPLYGDRDLNPTKASHSATTPRRADANVAAYRNLVFEFDTGTLPEQMEMIASRGLPYTTLVFSGGKSIHAVMALDESLKDEKTYRAYFNLVRDIMWKTDPSCVNPSRFTRIGGAYRPEKQTEQSLIAVRKKITLAELHRWFAYYEKHLARQRMNRIAHAATPKQQIATDGEIIFSESEAKFLAGEWDGKGSRHKRLVAIAYKCMEGGMSSDDCLALLINAHVALGIGRDVSEVDGIVEHVFLSGTKRVPN